MEGINFVGILFCFSIVRNLFNPKVLDMLVKRCKIFYHLLLNILVFYKSLWQSTGHKKVCERITKISKFICQKPISDCLTLTDFQLRSQRDNEYLLFKSNLNIIPTALRESG